jgi:hypothetical protein
VFRTPAIEPLAAELEALNLAAGGPGSEGLQVEVGDGGLHTAPKL